jgi:hypothetical protein
MTNTVTKLCLTLQNQGKTYKFRKDICQVLFEANRCLTHLCTRSPDFEPDVGFADSGVG